ncbi:MAG: CoA-binding protein [Bacteriovoracaceae bacterium]|nr:CoA-binding protein [Bacteriovoracaceae bacterium]
MKTENNETMVIIGISDNPERYSYKAFKALQNNSYNEIIGVTPKDITLEGIKIVSQLTKIEERVHTITLYANPTRTTPLIDNILKLSPKRIIMNPGTENQELKDKAELDGIEVVEGCTLVMLATSQF